MADLSLSIVTSCFNYGKYLADWARSILELTVPPAAVVMVDNGSTDETPAEMAAAAELLLEAGLEVETRRLDRTDFGTARNAAVELARTEWVMHLDADDMVMPHCLEDVAELAPAADVVALGYERTGDLRAGPGTGARIYRKSRGRETLRSTAPASGVSPFRRSFWERSPYRTDMEGGWDTALWIGFAHLGARFVATRRPCFWYRQHADSVFNTRRRSGRRSAVVGTKLKLLRRGVSGVSVLVPWRADGGARDAAWEWIRQRYERLHPGWEIVVGGCGAGSWRKGVAVADALSRASGEILVIADADCVVSAAALEEAVELAREVPWVVPHGLVKRLDRWSTERILLEGPGAELGGKLCRKAYRGFAGGGFVVVDRAKYEAAGGMPTEFEGWGAEDEALAAVLDTLVGAHVRLEAALFHFWHPSPGRWKSETYRRNRDRLARYLGARGDGSRMWALIHGLGVQEAEAPEVVMRAVKTWKRGSEEIAAGEVFYATEKEARRHAVRRARIAQRVR